jgi:hypothetical protein
MQIARNHNPGSSPGERTVCEDRQVDLISFEFGVVLALVVLLIVRVLVTYDRERLIGRLDMRLRGPAVPDVVLAAVRGAEVRWYQGLPLWRRSVKIAQDIAASAVPQAAFWMNSSIGPYRIKARTIHDLMPYALDRGYLRLNSGPDKRYNKLLPYFALQPLLNDWQAAVLLQSLKDKHPGLRQQTWKQIATDPTAIAKLYSGYMGAGGQWEQWRQTAAPGAVAQERLGHDPESGDYRFIHISQTP